MQEQQPAGESKTKALQRRLRSVFRKDWPVSTLLAARDLVAAQPDSALGWFRLGGALAVDPREASWPIMLRGLLARRGRRRTEARLPSIRQAWTKRPGSSGRQPEPPRE